MRFERRQDGREEERFENEVVASDALSAKLLEQLDDVDKTRAPRPVDMDNLGPKTEDI